MKREIARLLDSAKWHRMEATRLGICAMELLRNGSSDAAARLTQQAGRQALRAEAMTLGAEALDFVDQLGLHDNDHQGAPDAPPVSQQ